MWTFTAELFLWSDEQASWAFVALPKELADEVDETQVAPPRGFGSVRVEVEVGTTTWRTSLFPSKERETFVLPMKKAVRTAEHLEPGDAVTVGLTLLQ